VLHAVDEAFDEVAVLLVVAVRADVAGASRGGLAAAGAQQLAVGA
jgi:hypothetical protein